MSNRLYSGPCADLRLGLESFLDLPRLSDSELGHYKRLRQATELSVQLTVTVTVTLLLRLQLWCFKLSLVLMPILTWSRQLPPNVLPRIVLESEISASVGDCMQYLESFVPNYFIFSCSAQTHISPGTKFSRQNYPHITTCTYRVCGWLFKVLYCHSMSPGP